MYLSASKSLKFPERQQVPITPQPGFIVKGHYCYSKYVDLAVITSAAGALLYLKIFQHQPASELYNKAVKCKWDKTAFVHFEVLPVKTYMVPLWNLEADCAIRRVRFRLRFRKKTLKWLYQKSVLLQTPSVLTIMATAFNHVSDKKPLGKRWQITFKQTL